MRGIFQVCDHNPRLPAPRFFKSLDAVAGRIGTISPTGNQLGKPGQGIRFVFDNEDLLLVRPWYFRLSVKRGTLFSFLSRAMRCGGTGAAAWSNVCSIYEGI